MPFLLTLILPLLFSEPSRASDRRTEVRPVDCDISGGLNPLQSFQTFSSTRRGLNKYNASRIPKNLCGNVEEASCSAEFPPRDPTGKVELLFSTAVNRKLLTKQNEMIHQCDHDLNRLPKTRRPSRKDYLVEQSMTKRKFHQKLDRVDIVLNKVKSNIRRIMGREFRKMYPGDEQAISRMESKIAALLSKVKIDRDYRRNPDLLFEKDVIFNKSGLINIGGNFLDSVTSESSILFVLGHEMGHFLTGNNLQTQVFGKVTRCISSRFGNKTVHGKKFDKEEIWSDWFGGQVFAEHLTRLGSSPGVTAKQEMIKNAVRPFCGFPGSTQGHPPSSFRMNFILSNPTIAETACGRQSQAIKSQESLRCTN